MEINLQSLSFLNRVSFRDKALLSRQLATMISSGIALDRALSILSTSTKSQAIKFALEKIQKDIEAGNKFSSALAKHPNVFDPVFISSVQAGESSGKLDEVLTEVSSWLEEESDFLSRLRNALVYPIFIIMVMIVIVFIMLVKVVPQLKTIFASYEASLPWTTNLLISVSGFMAIYWWLVAAIIIGLVWALFYWIRQPSGQKFFDKFKIYEPTGVGIAIYMSRLARVMSMLLKSGVPIIQALNITALSVNNVWYSQALSNAVKDVERGVPLSATFEKNPVFPQIFSQMVVVGEQTGKIDEILDSLAKYYEAEVDNKLKGIIALFEPVLIVLIGLVIGFLVFSIIMPIYNLANII